MKQYENINFFQNLNSKFILTLLIVILSYIFLENSVKMFVGSFVNREEF